MWRIAILVIVLAVVYFYFYLQDLGEPFDVVYAWVDEYDPERDKYMGKIADGNTSIYRYNNANELSYSIRNLERYCKYVNNIFIVVKDGQMPNLDFSNPKFKIVNHSEILPSSALPTFNSCAIELCIHKIPGLLDRYLYFNDDMFVNKKLRWSDLFSRNSMPKVNVVKGSNDTVAKNTLYNFFVCYDNSIRIANRLLGMDIHDIKLPHTPSVCYKPWEYEIEGILKSANLWDSTVNSKFRDNNNIILNNTFRTVYYLSKGAEEAHWGDNYISLVNGNCKLNRGNNLFFCVNSISPDCKDAFKKQMDEL